MSTFLLGFGAGFDGGFSGFVLCGLVILSRLKAGAVVWFLVGFVVCSGFWWFLSYYEDWAVCVFAYFV